MEVVQPQLPTPEPLPEGPALPPVPPPAPRRPSAVRALLGPFIALAFLLFSYGKWALVLLKGTKFLGSGVSMAVSVGAYAIFFGWPFAVGFVALLFVHEMGHALQLRREGISAGAPVFIPFVGAAIAMREMPRDAAAEARVGIAGPILGTAGAVATHGAALALDSPLLLALAWIGYLLNLFNLVPISPLDGGRIAAALSPRLWIIGVVVMIALVVLMPNPVLVLIALLAVLDTWRRWRTRGEQPAYYAVPTHQRVVLGALWIGLLVSLPLLMHASFVPPG